MYTLTDVTKTYRKGDHSVTALEDLDLTIAEREWLAIQGRTGSGKTTLLQLLGALDHPNSGVINFDGRDLARLPEADLTEVRAASIGFVFQTFNLIPTLSAQENVEAALIPQRLSAAQRRERTADALASVGLAERADHLPSEMSGGQQQRVGIARALVKAPNVLLADEPTGNLDADTRDEIMALLETLWRDRGLTIVLVTHDTSIARRAQRIATMHDGHLSIATDEQAQSDPVTAGRSHTDPQRATDEPAQA
jgi:putative ABC transport system ATP-binding protein